MRNVISSGPCRIDAFIWVETALTTFLEVVTPLTLSDISRPNRRLLAAPALHAQRNGRRRGRSRESAHVKPRHVRARMRSNCLLGRAMYATAACAASPVAGAPCSHAARGAQRRTGRYTYPAGPRPRRRKTDQVGGGRRRSLYLAGPTATRRGRGQFGALHMSPGRSAAVRPVRRLPFPFLRRQAAGGAGGWRLSHLVCRDPLRLSLTGRIRILFSRSADRRTGMV
jgi:hypothetical protein